MLLHTFKFYNDWQLKIPCTAQHENTLMIWNAKISQGSFWVSGVAHCELVHPKNGSKMWSGLLKASSANRNKLLEIGALCQSANVVRRVLITYLPKSEYCFPQVIAIYGVEFKLTLEECSTIGRPCFRFVSSLISWLRVMEPSQVLLMTSSR
jgi:hypothetical protein